MIETESRRITGIEELKSAEPEKNRTEPVRISLSIAQHEMEGVTGESHTVLAAHQDNVCYIMQSRKQAAGDDQCGDHFHVQRSERRLKKEQQYEVRAAGQLLGVGVVIRFGDWRRNGERNR
jgi:hypothetical protein